MKDQVNLHMVERVLRVAAGLYLGYKALKARRPMGVLAAAPLVTSGFSGHCYGYEAIGVATEPYPRALLDSSIANGYVQALTYLLDKSEDLKEGIVDKGSHLKEDLVEKGVHIKDDLIERGAHIKDDLIEKGAHLKDDLLDKGLQLVDKVVDKTSELKDRVLHGAEQTRQQLAGA